MDRRIHQRHLAHLQVRVTDLASPDVSASGQSIDISESGIGVYLPLTFTPGSVVEIKIDDSELFGVVSFSMPERSFFRTGIEVWQVLIGRSEWRSFLRQHCKKRCQTRNWNTPNQPNIGKSELPRRDGSDSGAAMHREM